MSARAQFGDLSKVPAREFLYGLEPGKEHVASIEDGKTLLFEVQAIGDPDPEGIRSVVCRVNGTSIG